MYICVHQRTPINTWIVMCVYDIVMGMLWLSIDVCQNFMFYLIYDSRILQVFVIAWFYDQRERLPSLHFVFM